MISRWAGHRKVLYPVVFLDEGYEADRAHRPTIFLPDLPFHGWGTSVGGRLDLGLTAPRLVPLGAAHSPGLALLRQILPLLDHAGGEERNLRMLGLDDTNHRAVALLLAPKQLAWSGGSSCSSASPYARRFGESPSETLQKRGRGF